MDMKGDGEQYEEHTWAGQTRIRATTMLEGGFAGWLFILANMMPQAVIEQRLLFVMWHTCTVANVEMSSINL